MSTTTITVEGMTCAGCASSVRAELSQLAGVSEVTIDLMRGTVTIVSIGSVDPDAVRAAVEEAGYQLAS